MVEVASAAGARSCGASVSKTRPLSRTERPPAPSGSQYRSTPKSRASSTYSSFLAPPPARIGASTDHGCGELPCVRRRRSAWEGEDTAAGRRNRTCGGHPGSALSGARSRALLVGGVAAGARADEARPPAAPVPRQVHPAARRDAARPARSRRWARARSLRRLGHDARAGARVRVRRDRRRHRRFNALLARVKTRPYNLEALRRDLLWAHAEAEAFEPRGRYPREASAYVRAWFAPAAAEELLHFRSLVEQVGSADVLRIVLARSARSARRTAHFDLEFPREPQLEPYWCFKHRRECKPVESARRSCCATRSTRSSGSRRSRRCGPTATSPGCYMAMPARSTSKAPTMASSHHPRIRA